MSELITINRHECWMLKCELLERAESLDVRAFQNRIRAKKFRDDWQFWMKTAIKQERDARIFRERSKLWGQLALTVSNSQP